MAKKKARTKKKTGNFIFKNSDGVEYEVLYTKPNSLHYGDADGTCSPPDEETPKIHINPYLTKRNELNSALYPQGAPTNQNKAPKVVGPSKKTKPQEVTGQMIYLL